MSNGFPNTPFINNFRYKQSTCVSTNAGAGPFPILSVADGGNGQIVITTTDTSLLEAGVAVTISGTTDYNGDRTVISLTPTTFNVSDTFTSNQTGTYVIAANVTGSVAGEPLDFGQIFFYDQDDKITLQNTYSDRALTIPNPNPLITSSVGTTPVIYMLDEPYYIEIYDKFNNLVATLDNYLPTGTQDTPDTQISDENLLPNYGFETKINENIYGTVTVPPQDTTPVSAGWFWEIFTTAPSSSDTYSYNEVGASALEGNPKNELVLNSTNNTSGQTVNNLYTVLGTYNMFQGQQIAFAIYTELINGTTQTLPISLVRTKNGVAQTPIPLGSISITTTQTQRTIVFTVPALTTADFANNDELRLVIGLPLNEDFTHSYTGTWAQLSPDGTISVAETAVSTETAKNWFGNGSGDIGQDEQYKIRGLPTTVSPFGFATLPTTGTIFQGSTSATTAYSSFAASMVARGSEDLGVELVRDEIIGITQTNRLIDFLRANGYTQSRLTFLASNVANVVTVEFGIGAKENTAWSSLAAPRITVAKTLDELTYKLSAVPTGAGDVVFTFSDNFNALTNPFNPTYAPTLDPVYTSSALPVSSPIISWVGTTRWDEPNTAPINAFNAFDRALRVTTISNGSGSEPAVVKINFVDTYKTAIIKQWRISNDQGTFGNSLYVPHFVSVYTGLLNGNRAFDPAGAGLSRATVDVQGGFLAYNDIGNDPSTQPIQPPRVINFDTGAYQQEFRTGSISTLTVTLQDYHTASEVAAIVAQAVNTSSQHEITIASTPLNGDIVEISNAQTDFNLIFFDTAQTKPTNPSASRKPIFVEFSTAQTTTQIAEATANAIEAGVMGVPRAADLGLNFPFLNTQYFMFL